MHRAISLLLGFVAFLSKTAIIGVLIILTLYVPGESSLRTLSQVSVVLEGIVLAVLTWFILSHLSVSVQQWSIKYLGFYHGIYILAILSATSTTVATVIQFSKLILDKDEKLHRMSKDDLLIGLCVALGVGFALQTGFLYVHFSLHTLKGDRHSPLFCGKSFIKSLRYSQTAPGAAPISTTNSMGVGILCPSVGEGSRSGTVTSKVQITKAICPVKFKKELITNEAQRPTSAKSLLRRSFEDAFDTWDTLSVETLDRQVILKAMAPPRIKGQFLETSPKSPTRSKTPSPNNDKTPFSAARIQAPSRSYIPILSRRKHLSPQWSMNELDIHPVFRSGY